MQGIKTKVRIYGIKSEMVVIHGVVVSIFNKHNSECTITSGVEGEHRSRSLHPVGYAVDYRSKNLSHLIKKNILSDLIEALPCCDVLLEFVGNKQEHFHVEFDPKDDDRFQEDKLYYRKHGKWPKQ